MLWLSLQFLLGLSLLVGGGGLLVRGAAAIAGSLGVPSVVIGMTVVAFGPSMPELVVALTGSATGAGAIAFGNVVGSNIFNILLVLGLAATLSPIDVPARGPLSLSIALATSLLLLVLIHRGGLNLKRRDGVFLLAVFVAYLLLVAVYDRLDLPAG